MDRNRSTIAIACGLVAIGLAMWAVASDHRVVVLIAAIAAAVSTLLATNIPWDVMAGNRERARLAEEASRLAQERSAAVVRANQYQAEAISARTQLEDALRREPVVATTTESAELTVDLTADSTDLLFDDQTGLFSELFFNASLIKRVAAARRGLRPLTVGVVSVVTDLGSGRPKPADPALVKQALTTVFRESDTIARGDDGSFMLLLEDTPESGAVWTFERLRRQIVDDNPGHTVWVGVSCYPAYGFDADQLMTQAREALERAMEWRQDRVEITDAVPET